MKNRTLNAVLAVFVAVPALSSAPALAGDARWKPADGEQIFWRIDDEKNKPIGQMTMRFERGEDGSLTFVRTQAVRMRKFMMNLKLDQEIREQWDRSGFQSLTAWTKAEAPIFSRDADLKVTRRSEGGLKIESSEFGERIEKRNLWPMTMWHASFLKNDVMFDAGVGEPRPLDKSDLGEKPIDIGDATALCKGTRINTTGDGDEKIEVDMWFTQTGEPCYMEFEGQFGRTYVHRVAEQYEITKK